jgi:hypothetical protein
VTGYDESPASPPLVCTRRGTDVLSGSCRQIRSEGNDHSGGQRLWRPIEAASSTDTDTPEDIALRAEVSAARRDDAPTPISVGLLGQMGAEMPPAENATCGH